MKKEDKKPEILEGQVLEVEYGRNLIIPVYGENSAQDSRQTTLKKLYKEANNKHIRLSLTPICAYQENMGWPEKPFLNVNTLGALETTKDNWLGYIHPFEPKEKTKERLERKEYVRKLIKLGEITPLVISGKVIKEDDGYSLLLFASRKYIDATLEEITKLQPKWEENKKFRKKKKTIIIISILLILIILGIIFWKYALFILVFMTLLLALLASKK